MNRVRVILRDIPVDQFRYYDWLTTGLAQLAECGAIDFQFQMTAVGALFRLHPKVLPAMQKFAPSLLARLRTDVARGEVLLGARRVAFAFDVLDSPYMFDVKLLQETDVYFKCQCPAKLDERGFPIARGAWVPFHPDVLRFRERIAPAMLGRPLSRSLSLRQNRVVLAKWQARAKSVARAAEAARNQGDPGGSRRTNYEGQAGRGVQRQEERPEARQGVGFVHSSPWQDASLEAGEGANRLTKHAQATTCRKNDGLTLANLPAGDTPRVSLRSPVRANHTPGSVRGAPGNRCPYLDTSKELLLRRPVLAFAAHPLAKDAGVQLAAPSVANSITRAALSTSGRPKTHFLPVLGELEG
jgi:hypothetical protein